MAWHIYERCIEELITWKICLSSAFWKSLCTVFTYKAKVHLHGDAIGKYELDGVRLQLLFAAKNNQEIHQYDIKNKP